MSKYLTILLFLAYLNASFLPVTFSIVHPTVVEDGAVDPNGGLIVSKPRGGIVAQGIKEDNVVFTTNKPTSNASSSPSMASLPPEVLRMFEEMNNKLSTIAAKDIKLVVGIDEWNTSQTQGSVRVQ